MKKLLLLLLLSVSCSPLLAQSITGVMKGSQPAAQPGAEGADPLGRETPSGTVFGFLQAAQAGNYKNAAEYLQMSAARRQSEGPELARQLKELMDRTFTGTMRHLSSRPEGSMEGGGLGRETVGTFSSDEQDIPVVLVRVDNPNSGKIWLFAADTLTRVPALYDNLKVHRVEKSLPPRLVENQFLGVPLWQWIALLLAVPVAWGVAWLVIAALAVPRRLWLKYRKQPNLHTFGRVSAPLLVLFGALAHRTMVVRVGLPLLPRSYYFRAIGVVAEIGFFWLLLRISGLTLKRLQTRAISVGRTGTSTLIVLGQRLTSALILMVAVLVVLSTLGFNLTTVLAGLGIGGIAVAFAAQKTLENLFGGVSVLADEVIRVGDSGRFGDRVGTIEDISLRSTRIRTIERSELSIPNGTLATMSIENLTRRDKILFNPTLNLRYGTSPDQLRYVLANVRRMFYEHPRVENETARIRFAGLDNSALTLEVFSYVLTPDFAEFTALREDLLFRIMDIVEKSGTAFALPSQTVYAASDAGIDTERTFAAEQQVRKWRDAQQLPFPDFGATDKAMFRDSIVYPDPDSAVAPKPR